MKNDEIRLECVRLAEYITSSYSVVNDGITRFGKDTGKILETASEIYDWIYGRTNTYEPVTPNSIPEPPWTVTC